MLKNYFKTALRNFWRHKLFTIINVTGLTIGISAALVIYLIVHFDFTFDKFHPDGDRIYRVVSVFGFNGEPSYNSGVSGALPHATQSEVTGLKVAAPFITYQTDVLVPGKNTPSKFKNQDNIAITDQRYFAVFHYKWLAGSAKTALNEPNRVVLAARQAQLYFPGLTYSQMLGKEVVYEDSVKTTVTGIVQDFTENSDFTFHDFISLSTKKTVKSFGDQMNDADWEGTSSSTQLFVMLNNGASTVNIEHQLNDLLKKNSPPKPQDKGSTREFKLQPLSDLHFDEKYDNFDGGHIANKTTMYGLLLVALFLLLLGCINFINLTTAQGAQRAKEIGIRKTMGSSRSQLIIQFLSETFIITLFTVIIAAAIAPQLLKLFADFTPKGLKADLFQPAIIVFLILITVAVSLLAGFYPAILLSGYKPVSVLKNQLHNSAGKSRSIFLRKTLIVTQFIIAQFFIMTTLVVSKQIYYLLHKDLGFKKEAIIYLTTPYKSIYAGRKQVFINKLNALPQLQMISIGGNPPASGGTYSTYAEYKDGKREIKTEVEEKFGDENYLKVYGLKLLAGRALQSADSTKAILINANYARVLGFKSPKDVVGALLKFSGHEHIQIAGVIADFHQKSLRTPIKPLAILMPKKYNNLTVHIALTPQTINGREWKMAISGIEKSWKQIYPEETLEYHFYDDSIAEFYEKEQHTSKLLGWATGLSILISCLGLLGLAMYTTNLRTKEIGVRKVLGATVTQIVALLSTELIWLIALAFVLVTPVAWFAVNKWMQNFAYRTTISWWVFGLSGAGMLVTALFTLSFQTVKAALANPARSLKSE